MKYMVIFGKISEQEIGKGWRSIRTLEMEGPKIWKCSRKRDSDVSRGVRGEEWQKSNESEGMNLEAVGYRGVRNKMMHYIFISKIQKLVFL